MNIFKINGDDVTVSFFHAGPILTYVMEDLFSFIKIFDLAFQHAHL